MKKSTTNRVFVNSFRKTALALMACMFVLNACKKDSDDAAAPANPTKTELLTSKPWRLTASTVSPAFMGVTNMYTMMPSCETDNTYKFNSDAGKTYIENEGATLCNSMDPQTVTGSWQFNSNETSVTTTLNGSTETFMLNSISSSALTVSFTMDMSGTTYTVTNTYSNQ